MTKIIYNYIMPNGLFSAGYCSNIIKCLRFYLSSPVRVLKRLLPWSLIYVRTI